MSNEILFRSPCPSVTCNDTTIYRWYHDTCPSSSNEYLSSEAKVRCDYCGKKWDFFNSLFYCEYSKNKWEKSNLKKAINCFTALFMANELSADFLIKIKGSLTEQEAKYR